MGPLTPARRAELAVRSARDADLDDIEDMINDFVKGHPAETHSRSRSKLREAYFGAAPQALADLAGLAPRDIIRRLPDPALNKVAARARG